MLFDLDGVLADTEPLHWTAYREVLLELGVDVGIEEYRRRFISHGGGPEYACEAYRLPLTADNDFTGCTVRLSHLDELTPALLRRL